MILYTAHRFKRMLFSLATLAALGAIYPLTSTAAASPTMNLSIRTGPPTTKVKISGVGFGSKETIIISFDTSQIYTTMSTPSGTYATLIVIPASASPGNHSIEAAGQISGVTVQATFLVQTNWPQFGLDSSHTRFNPYENILNPTTVPHLQINWRTPTSSIGYSSPILSHGIIYIGSYDDTLRAFDAATGTLLWTAMTGDRINSSPAVSNGVVYIASDKLYAFNAKTGALLWFGTTGNMYFGYIESSPTVFNGVVYIGSVDKKVYAFNAAGCGSASCLPLWTTSTSDVIVSSPTVTNGIIYVTSGNFLYALSVKTGAILWTANAPSTSYAWSSPAVTMGIVYVCADDRVYAFHALDGSPLWTTSIGDLVTITSSPAVANGILYVGSDDENLYAFDANTGVLRWKISTNGRLESSAAVAGGVVYIGSDIDYKINAFDATTGAALWSYTTGSRVYASPTIADGIVYIGSDALYAFHIPSS